MRKNGVRKNGVGNWVRELPSKFRGAKTGASVRPAAQVPQFVTVFDAFWAGLCVDLAVTAAACNSFVTGRMRGGAGLRSTRSALLDAAMKPAHDAALGALFSIKDCLQHRLESECVGHGVHLPGMAHVGGRRISNRTNLAHVGGRETSLAHDSLPVFP